MTMRGLLRRWRAWRDPTVGVLARSIVPRSPMARSLGGPNPRVRIDEHSVAVLSTDGRWHEVAWGDLRRVEIHATTGGPFAEDRYWVLVGSEGEECVVPHSSPSSRLLLHHLQELPGFDDREVIEAMGPSDPHVFVCWSRPGASA
jgi:hypothetical protein